MKRLLQRRARWALGGIVVIGLFSLLANALLLRELQNAFAKLQWARIFPLGTADAARPTTAEVAGRPSLAFWGDSRALLWDARALEPQWNVRRFAVGGITSSQLRLQLETRPVPHSAVAVVQVGINDLHPLGALAPYRQRVLDQLHDNLEAIRNALLAHCDVLVLTTIFPPGAVPLARRSAWDPATAELVAQVNNMIRAAADGRRVLVFDAHALLRDPGGQLAAPYVDDDFFLHVNRQAYARLNSALEPVLAKLAPLRN